MALPAIIKFLLAASLLALWGTKGMAQAPDFHPLQPDKVEWADQVGRHAKVRKDSNLLAEHHYLYGKIYEASGNYLMSKRHYLQSMRIQEARGYDLALTRLYQRLSNLENLLLSRAEAFRYARLGMQIAERIDTDEARLRAYGTMTLLYNSQSGADTLIAVDAPKPQNDSALHYLYKTEPIARRIGKPFDLLVLDHMLGGEMLRQKDRRALAYFQDAINISQEINKPFEQVGSMMALARAHLSFGNPEEAYVLIKRAKELHGTLSHENQDVMRGLEGLYLGYYQSVGNWKAALEHTGKLHEMERQNYLIDREGAVTKLGYEYETEKKEAQLASQQKKLALKNENLRTQQWLLFAAATALLLAIGAVAIYYRLYRQKQRLSRHNAELVDEQNHRVKNNLQVVSGLLQLQVNRLADPSTIAAVKDMQSRIEVMAVLQRKLYDASRTTASRASEFIREVVGTSLKSFGCGGIAPDYNIPENIALAPDQALAVGLIVNELTTNACKYAFPDHPAPTLSIETRMEGEDFHLRLSDNGAGFMPMPNVRGRKSLGMKIIQLQVAQLNGEYSFDTNDGTTFQMSFKV